MRPVCMIFVAKSSDNFSITEFMFPWKTSFAEIRQRKAPESILYSCKRPAVGVKSMFGSPSLSESQLSVIRFTNGAGRRE